MQSKKKAVAVGTLFHKLPLYLVTLNICTVQAYLEKEIDLSVFIKVLMVSAWLDSISGKATGNLMAITE